MRMRLRLRLDYLAHVACARKSPAAVSATLSTLLIALVVVSAPVAGQADPRAVTGRVVDKRGATIPGIIVEFLSKCRIDRVTTDNSGTYRVPQPANLASLTLLFVDDTEKWEPLSLTGLVGGSVADVALLPAGVEHTPAEAQQILAHYAALRLLLSGGDCPPDLKRMETLRAQLSRMILPKDDAVRLAYEDVRLLWGIPSTSASTPPPTAAHEKRSGDPKSAGSMWEIPYE